MRHTILVATLSSVAASVLTTAVITGLLFGAETARSASVPDPQAAAVQPGGVQGYIQGDINCDGIVDAKDALGDLRYVGGLDVAQEEPCPDVGTLGAIEGPPGPQGEQGPPGPQGPAGPVGLAELEVVVKETTQDSSASKSVTADCPAGKTLIGGGTRITSAGTTTGLALSDSWPTSDLASWIGGGIETTPNPSFWSVRALAICANVAE